MAKKRRSEERKLRAALIGARKGREGKTRRALDGGGLETRAAQQSLFTMRANELDEAQILIFSMYMDEY